MLPREFFEDAASRINCLNTRRHAQLLHGLLRWLRPQSVVEVGSYTGYTAVWMARALQENALDGAPGRLWCIDDFSLAGQEAFCAFWHNVGACGVGDVVSLEPKASAEAEWPERVDFAFIDGDHSYEACRHDAEKAIALGARCVALHDVQDWWGPREYFFHTPAGDRSVREFNSFYATFDGGLGVLLRHEVIPPATYERETYPLGRIVAMAEV